MNIYYTSYLNTGVPIETNLSFYEPQRLVGIETEEYSNTQSLQNKNNYNVCPAYVDYFKNLYTINSQIDYDLFWNENKTELKTSYRDQKYFDKLVNVRSIEQKLISFDILYLFIPECDELFVTEEKCLYKSNSFIDNTMIIPGTFDIAKWPRPLETAFHLTGNGFEIKHGDPLFSLRFHTKEKIKFKRFLMTDKMDNYIKYMIDSSKNFKRLKDLSVLYDLIANKNKKYKRFMLQEARKNLLD